MGHVLALSLMVFEINATTQTEVCKACIPLHPENNAPNTVGVQESLDRYVSVSKQLNSKH